VIDPQPQQRARWCVPAALHAAFEPTRSQARLAEALRTTSRGSYLHRAPGVVSSPVAFSFGVASYRDGPHLMTRIKQAIARTSRAVVLGVEGDLLPYWPRGWSGLHAIVVVGWSGEDVLVWDPLDAAWNARGYHRVSPGALARAGTLNGRAAVWPAH
jgi:hypothetical protein